MTLWSKVDAGTIHGCISRCGGGHVILKVSGQFLQTLNVRLGEEPPKLDDLSPPYFVDEFTCATSQGSSKDKARDLQFRDRTRWSSVPSSSTAPSPQEAIPGSETEPGGPVFPSSSTAPSPTKRLLVQVQSATVSLRPIRTMIDLALLRATMALTWTTLMPVTLWSFIYGQKDSKTQCLVRC